MTAERAADASGDPAAQASVLSVVVPSYNRRDALALVLAGLAAERRAADAAGGPPFETIVVLDGSTDGSDTLLAGWQRADRLPGLRWMSQANAGQAAARDAGARAAAAPILLFLDDDVAPEPGLIARHLTSHAGGGRLAVLGDCEIVRGPTPSFYLQQLWAWWEALYSQRALPGRRPCYLDFCAGNVSLRRADYLASGGFDPAFRGYGGEDYDLGYRLLQQGVRFVADRQARALHYHATPDAERLLRARRQEGTAAVLLGSKHPELRAGLRLATPPWADPWSDPLAHRAFTERGLTPAEQRVRVARLAMHERLGQRAPWALQLGRLRTYAYWRGVYEALGSREALDAFRHEAALPVRPLEVGQGLGALPDDFWVHGPSELRVTAGGEALGTVRLPGPVLDPLRDVVSDALARGLGATLWAWTARTGVPVLPTGRLA